MRIRTASEADIPVLFEIRTTVRENHLSLERLAALGITPGSLGEMMRTSSRVWVAEVEGQPVAFSMANAEEGTIFAMFVRIGYEGRGLGRALMREAEAWLFEQGWEEIWLLTGGDAPLANGFYRHLGWQDMGVQEDGQIKYVRRRG